MTERPDPRQTDLWGIDRYYEDAFGEWHATPESTLVAIMKAMEADPDQNGPAGDPPVLFIRPGRPTCLIEAGELTLESGERLGVSCGLPANPPIGYHTLQPEDGSRPIRVISCPDRCHLPEDLRIWGWSLQLYALRSANSWGIGDLHDLGELA